jgi:hypothetical protein
MTEAAERKALRAVRKAQTEFENADMQREKKREARRTVFEEAQAAGLSMHAIARETGLHVSRVSEIIRGRS